MVAWGSAGQAEPRPELHAFLSHNGRGDLPMQAARGCNWCALAGGTENMGTPLGLWGRQKWQGGQSPGLWVWRLGPIPAMPPAASFSLKLLAVPIQRKGLGGGTDSSVPLLRRPSRLGQELPLESSSPLGECSGLR